MDGDPAPFLRRDRENAGGSGRRWGNGVTRKLWLLVHLDLRPAARPRAGMEHIVAVCRGLKNNEAAAVAQIAPTFPGRNFEPEKI
ncbi:hypothetical protein EZH22_14055 [Xanthobacter dioxanivorans]|uniref:Uncharacterized protein n=1 Tax=Xanthobacter dioxanivorans TaxID=2528964 RepID=A0A974PTN6_9HYPH|nr:hypothetical protein [Xanthobacter dioxanivorans]QRG09276.1 hypothetical protein EZH22_14055 [Xanthobacter dioxanivorans]